MSQSGVELEQMVAKRDSEIVRLREEVQRLQLTLQDIQQSTANHISCLEQQLTSKMENIERLKAKLNSQQDYEKIKEELRVLKEKRGALEHFNLLPLYSPTSESTVLTTEEEILSQRPCAEDRADQNVTGVKIKREAETPSEDHPSMELVERLSTLADISCGLTESSRKATPSPFPKCLSPHDHLPNVCIDTKYISRDSSFRQDTCSTGENGNTCASWSMNHDILEGRFMEGLENQIETAEITQQVKDLLHKYKIGQRVFGYYVLDRLQGSVSEILAHPKPWDKLTTRGKEPFLRMIHFLSDEQNVLALRMIQDRLRASSPSPNILGSSSPVHSSEKGADDVIRNILEQAKREFQSQNRGNETRIQQGQSKCNATHDNNSTGRGTEDIIKSILEQARLDMKVQQDSKGQNKGRVGDLLKTSETDKGKNLHQDSSDFVQKIIRKVKSEIVSETSFSASEIPPLLPAQSSTNPSSTAPIPFSDANHNHCSSRKQDKVLSPHPGGEMQFAGTKLHPEEDLAGKFIHPIHLASEGHKENWHPPQAKDGQRHAGSCSYHNGLDTQQLKIQSLQLDTQIITRRVKEILAENRLGQRLFGEHVVGLTQGSVSDLLSWPKPWSELSTKGKEPFLRMYFWLKDPQNVDHLKTLKSTGQRAHGKRPLSPLRLSQEALQDRSLTGLASVDHPGWFEMAKRARVVLSFEEKEILKRTFQLDPYPSQQTIQTLALQLDLRPSTVTNWFSNHRSRQRRPVQDGSSVVTNHINSPLSDTEVKTHHHCSEANPCSDSSPPCMGSLITVKQEPGEAVISEMSGEETDIHWDAKYVSTGVQSSRNLKIEEEEGRIILSPQPKEGYWLDKMVKEDSDRAGQDSTVFSASQKGDSTDLMTTSLNSRENNTILLSEEQC